MLGAGLGAAVLGSRAEASGSPQSYFPADAGLFDVRSFGAMGDGVADDTAAILRAIADLPPYRADNPYLTRIIYFPAGTYLVTDTILRKDTASRHAPGLILIGDDRATTTIKLADRAAGFESAARPKAVIYTSSGLQFMANPRDGGRDYLDKGEGNEAFGNTVENLTVNVGTGNPGAIGIDFLANNVGAIRNVTIRAPSRAAVGVSMVRRWPGPALISDVLIQGFETGIDIAYSNYSMTLDKVRIEGSRQYAIRNSSNVVSFSDLYIVTAAGVGVANLAADGLIVGIGGVIEGRGTAPLVNSGSINFKDVAASNFKDAAGKANDQKLDGVFQVARKLSNAKWQLPVRSPPKPAPAGKDDWVNIQKFGAVADRRRDSTAAFQAAFKSDACVVYIPSGEYAVSMPFEVSDSIERIEGMFAVINIGNDPRAVDGAPSALFRTKPARIAPLHIRRLVVYRRGNMSTIVDHRGGGPLVMSDIVGLGGAGLFHRAASGGPVFADNTSAGHTQISGKAGVWLRQYNAEGPTIRLSNDGAPLWILGAKTEQTNTLVQSMNGANTEVVGGFIYRVFGQATEMPAFTNSDARLALSYAEESFRPDAIYSIHLDSRVGGKHVVVRAEDLPRRGQFARMCASLSTDDAAP